MRFNVVINQQKCIQHGLNQNQAALMGLFNELSSWATEKVIKGKMYWHISRNKVIEEIPLFYKKPDTVYRAFGFLEERGMIEYLQQNRMDFVRLTPKGKAWNKLGNKSEFGNESEQLGNESEFDVLPNPDESQTVKPVFSEMNPTYNIHNNTNHKREEALAFFERNFPTAFEAFRMQFETALGTDWNDFVNNYNAKVEKEGLAYDLHALNGRAKELAQNWIRNKGKFKNGGVVPMQQEVPKGRIFKGY